MHSVSSLGSYHTVPEGRDTLTSQSAVWNSRPASSGFLIDAPGGGSGGSSNSLDRLLPGKTHRRVLSNPFEIVYDPAAATSTAPVALDAQSIERYKSPGYLEIEKAIGRGHTHRNERSSQIFSPTSSPYKRSSPESTGALARSRLPAHSEIPPVVTIIGEQSILKRASSVISSEASLRHRNSIRNRSRMVRRADLQPPQKPHSPVLIAPQPATPPKPSRRLRFTFPVRRQKSFKRASHYRSLAAGPAKFETASDLYNFYYNQDAARVIRELLPHSMLFHAYTNLPSINPTLHQRLRRTVMDSTYTSNVVDSSRPISAPVVGTFRKKNAPLGDPTNTYDLARAVFDKYRNAVFANKRTTPGTFYEMFPEERSSTLVSPEDADFYTTRLCLEVLLRRTTAAKIKYRLKGNKRPKMANGSDIDSSPDSDSSASQSNKNESLPRLSADSGESDSDSVNTDDLMQQNASLYSGLLPSPQISYSSNIFGSDFDLPINETNLKQVSPPLKSPILDTRRFSQDSYRLQPMNRSMVTLSSSEESVSPARQASGELLTIDSEVRNSSTSKEDSSREFSRDKRRKSLSTAHSSLLHDLDGLTSELSSYMKDDHDQKITSPPPLEIKTYGYTPQVRHVVAASQRASIYAESTDTSPMKGDYEPEGGFSVPRREDSVSTRSGMSTVRASGK